MSAEFVELRQARGRGRGVFALKQLNAGTLIHVSDEPLVSVICSPYRKEVCRTCFAYDNGRKLKFPLYATLRGPGVAWFCSDACRSTYQTTHDEQTINALQMIDIVLSRSLSQKASAFAMADPPTEKMTGKVENVRWRANDLLPPNVDPDMVRYFSSGFLLHRRDPARYDTELLNLEVSPIAYTSQDTLQLDLVTARFLLSLWPASPVSLVKQLRQRDTGNSFGIRDDFGNELLGFATYGMPTSGFNHSCAPNVSKIRQGDRWHFTTSSKIDAGDELCISYVGDVDIDRAERQRRLLDGWGFLCACERCRREDA